MNQEAKHHRILYPFFKWVISCLIRKHQHSIRTFGDCPDRGLPVLLIANHMSWWDGCWALHFNQHAFNRRFHFMMQEEQLRKHWYFQYTGGFPVKKNSRTAIETLAYTARLLSKPDNLVLIFPQGKIQSMHQRNICFERGLEKILAQLEAEIQIVFLVNLVDYFSNKRPTVYQYTGEYRGTKKDLASIQDSYRAFYEKACEQQTRQQLKA